jgi:hypothetical protein
MRHFIYGILFGIVLWFTGNIFITVAFGSVDTTVPEVEVEAYELSGDFVESMWRLEMVEQWLKEKYPERYESDEPIDIREEINALPRQ